MWTLDLLTTVHYVYRAPRSALEGREPNQSGEVWSDTPSFSTCLDLAFLGLAPGEGGVRTRGSRLKMAGRKCLEMLMECLGPMPPPP